MIIILLKSFGINLSIVKRLTDDNIYTCSKLAIMRMHKLDMYERICVITYAKSVK